MFRTVLIGLLVLGGASAWILTLSRSDASPPHLVQYQGRLADSNGVPLEGTVDRLTLRLYNTAAPSSATFVWGEVHLGVPVRRGVFTLHLGAGHARVDAQGNETPGANPIRAGHFDDGPRFLEVQVDADLPLAPTTRIGSVPHAISAGGSVPVGGIVDWYRPSTSTPVPPGWAICDGTAISDPDSVFHGLATPDLVGRFVLGLDPALIGVTSYGADAATTLPDQGGADAHDLTHGHTVQAHTHSLPAHSHEITFDGAHGHPGSFVGDPSGHITTHAVNHGGGGQWVMLGPGPNCQHSVPVQVANAGSHNHGGATGLGGGGQTGTQAPATNTALGAIDNRPRYVGLLKLIRIK